MSLESTAPPSGMQRIRRTIPPGVRARLRPLVKWWKRTGHREQLTRALGPTLASLSGQILDVGGGEHALHDLLLNGSARRIRLDIAGDADIQADACAIPLTSESVDAVIMCEVLEHIAAPTAAISEIHRVLRPGGVFCGSVPFVYTVHGSPNDFFRYTPDGVRYLMAGFESVNVIPHGNPVSAAWIILRNRYRLLRLINPLMRKLSRFANADCPEGVTFVAIK